MNNALQAMLSQHAPQTFPEHVRALREIQQAIVLLGLWRSKFFEHAAFYGGTALRMLYGLDRYSEDIDFSLLCPNRQFQLEDHARSACRELESYGFSVTLSEVQADRQIHSAFIKGETIKHLLVIEAERAMRGNIPGGQLLKIKLEVDTNPPPGFLTENRYLLNPIPFAIRTYSLPDLFSGKMHAVLCRTWKTRVKGRDWYDFSWFACNHPELRLSHLEQRMRQSGDWDEDQAMTRGAFEELLVQAIDKLDIDNAKRDVRPFLRDATALAVWSKDFFRHLISRIIVVETK
jgi:predicted nucleotidyltransferase component of viral defense system